MAVASTAPATTTAAGAATTPAIAATAAAQVAPKAAAAATATSAAPPAAAPSTAPAAPTMTAVAPATSGAPGAAKSDGKAVYEKVCSVCHAAGIAGAPKFGDKTAWAPRIATGIASLHTSALKGKNAMPPKGGNLALPDADVTAAVDYMVAAAK